MPLQTSSSPRIFAIIPAAGIGQRCQQIVPKQYVCIHGKPILQFSLDLLLQSSRIDQVLIAVSAQDHQYTKFDWPDTPRLRIEPIGGTTRQHTVKNALSTLSNADEEDWILVHDAARPCLSQLILAQFIETMYLEPIGGLLALPSSDTVKKSNADCTHVACTLERKTIFLAQTPQMFRKAILTQALEHMHQHHKTMTDEAGAVEALGLQPKIFQGSPTNLKVTYPTDLAIATQLLNALSSNLTAKT